MIVARDKKGIIKQDINMDRVNGKRVIEINKLKEQEAKIKKGKKA